MNITREQYEADIRKAKADALRDASREYRAREAERFSGDRVARLLNARADEVEQ